MQLSWLLQLLVPKLKHISKKWLDYITKAGRMRVVKARIFEKGNAIELFCTKQKLTFYTQKNEVVNHNYLHKDLIFVAYCIKTSPETYSMNF